MTLLCFFNGDSFATGATRYSYRPATNTETTNRIILKVAIQGVITEAVMDTGDPYVICSPTIARRAGVDRSAALKSEIMLIRGMRIEGSLFRLNVSLVALGIIWMWMQRFLSPILIIYGEIFPHLLG